ncbi:hypothetical protein AUF78_17565 [archaeon 13_1_20CM_2_51_12]|nr:MAG: hypothetical protein AUI97_05920 [Crenarchaeota archaeon 13_1_40CM_3_52_17]OLE68110.1 MAG: hypothetical protein AUF78_17565 [archaeon 13_1_20CM_2_51_12]
MLLLAASTITQARAQGTVGVTISPPSVLLDYHVDFLENFTSLSQSRVVIDTSNSSVLVKTVENAMQKLVPGAHLDPSTFKFEANIEQQSTNSNMWTIAENLTGTVTGAGSGLPGIMNYNLGFLSMNISDSLQFGGVEFNKIGRAYIVQPLDSQRKGTSFYLDQSLARGGPYSNTVIPGNATSKFNLLDFSWVPKISSWTHSYRPFDSKSTWTLNPQTDLHALPFNVTAGIPSPEGPLITSLVAFLNPTLVLTTPPRSWSEGSTVSYNVPTAAAAVMALILVAVVVLTAVSYFVERKVVRPVAQYRKKRR